MMSKTERALCKAYQQVDTSGEVLRERLFAVLKDGRVYVSDWGPYSNSFEMSRGGKPRVWSASPQTVLQVETLLGWNGYLGNYFVPAGILRLDEPHVMVDDFGNPISAYYYDPKGQLNTVGHAMVAFVVDGVTYDNFYA